MLLNSFLLDVRDKPEEKVEAVDGQFVVSREGEEDNVSLPVVCGVFEPMLSGSGGSAL